MARPKKNRIVYSMPSSEGFIPIGFESTGNIETIKLTIDEYESIRLIDFIGLTQEDCAANMKISRPTVTNIYESARKKIADALINEKVLLIEGGDFDVFQGNKKIGKLKKENEIMKIAVTYDNGQIFQHFGHCENFKIYTISDNKVVSSEIINAGGSGHGALAGFLKEQGAETLICGGIGGGAQTALAEAGISLFGGCTGDADGAVNALLSNSLEYNANVQCNHHGEGHSCGNHEHGDNHSCGNGGCHH